MFDFKTSFGGILQLEKCDANSIVNAIKDFYAKNMLDLRKMVIC